MVTRIALGTIEIKKRYHPLMTATWEDPEFVPVGLAPPEDWDATGRPVEDTCVETDGGEMTGVVERALTVVPPTVEPPVGVALELVPVTNKPFPMELIVAHEEDDGTGCAEGVTGSPWWKVDAP
jgi:hypothetical protein